MLSYSPETGNAPLTVKFFGLYNGKGEVKKWGWNFGDGQGSSEQNPVHTYKMAGEYNVRLTISNDCSSFSASGYRPIVVTMGDPPGPTPTKTLVQMKSLDTDQNLPLESGHTAAVSAPSQNSFFPTWLLSGLQPLISPVYSILPGSSSSGSDMTGVQPPVVSGPSSANTAPDIGTEIQKSGSEPHAFEPSTKKSGTGEIVSIPQGDSPKVFLPDNVVAVVTTTPVPNPNPQNFVPIVTVQQDTGAAPVVEVVTPSGGYQLAPALRPTCTAPLVTCNNVCADLTTDVNNCGACGNVCADGYTCSGSMCAKVMGGQGLAKPVI